MQDLYGTYRGFTPTDESNVGMGEMQVVIDDNGMAMTIATGLGLETDSIGPEHLREMTTDEITAFFNDGADIEGIRAVTLGETGVTYLFLTKDDPTVLVMGMFGSEVFGPSFLMPPDRVAKGDFDLALREMEKEFGYPGATPLISNGGKAMAVDRN